MNELLIGLVGALITTNQPLAVSNLIQQNAGVSVTIVNPNDPAEKELAQLMAEDDAAVTEVDKWIQGNNAFAAQGAGESKEALNRRIRARLEPVRKDYEDFLRRYPDFARGHLAYGSFLNDIGEEEAAGAQYGKAAQLDPKNPAAWNQLANYYGEHGPLTNAFVDYAKAIDLNPAEPVYYQNLAAMVYLFRKDARAFYGITEEQVFDKALALYCKAIQLDPQNFPLATDYAQTYYGIRPLRTNDALGAWTNALQIAHDDNEREGVYLHLARIKTAAGRFAEARTHLNDVTNAAFSDVKHRLERNLAERENTATNPGTAGISTNAPGFLTNKVVAPTNAATVASKTNLAPTPSLLVLSNGVPALTNPPPFVPAMAPVLTNIPPVPPPASPLPFP
ncbi:MAG: tetratricopeptide repeat protein [Limisphaerales bacterium]